MKKFSGILNVIKPDRTIKWLLPLIVGILMSANFAYAAPPKWETNKAEHAQAQTVIKENDIEIKAGRGVIIVATSRPVQIKVYTILGQLVSRETLPAGISQLNVQAHGVYIIKSGELTCKVAL